MRSEARRPWGSLTIMADPFDLERFYLSIVPGDFSRYVIAWELCAEMAASDVTDTLERALEASGCHTARVQNRPRLLSDDGPS